jgi:hypothetical protein
MLGPDSTQKFYVSVQADGDDSAGSAQACFNRISTSKTNAAAAKIPTAAVIASTVSVREERDYELLSAVKNGEVELKPFAPSPP